MMRSLFLILGVLSSTHAVTAATQIHAPDVQIIMRSGTALEKRGRAQLERLLRAYDLSPWLFTPLVEIETRAVPHSHPVLTLNTRYVDDDIAQLATFIHEQTHWFLVSRPAAVDAAAADLREMFPDAPDKLPEGARDEESTYLHLVVCFLELAGTADLAGEDVARQQLADWTHYTWIYRQVLTHTAAIGAIVHDHGLDPRQTTPAPPEAQRQSRSAGDHLERGANFHRTKEMKRSATNSR